VYSRHSNDAPDHEPPGGPTGGTTVTLWVDVARVAIVGNLALLAGVLYTWGRTYRAPGSKHTLRLLVFGGLLAAENASALYVYFLHPVLRVWVTSVPPIAQGAMTLLRVLELFALMVLFWITWD
jgi:hypothetical protein